MPEIFIIDAEWNVCSNCEYWDPEPEQVIWGRCYRYPPQAVITKEGEIDWVFPKTEARSGCGEFIKRLVGRIPIQIEGDIDGEGI